MRKFLNTLLLLSTAQLTFAQGQSFINKATDMSTFRGGSRTDTIDIIPQDTLKPAWYVGSLVGSIAVKDGNFYWYANGKYQSWDTIKLSDRINEKQDALTLTTIGTSGAATLVGDTLNIPNYASAGGGPFYDSTLMATQKNLKDTASAINGRLASYYLSSNPSGYITTVDTGRANGKIASAYAQTKIKDSLGAIINLKVDSVRRLSGSQQVQQKINGTWVNAYIDSVGAGGGSGSQDLTSVLGIGNLGANWARFASDANTSAATPYTPSIEAVSTNYPGIIIRESGSGFGRGHFLGMGADTRLRHFPLVNPNGFQMNIGQSGIIDGISILSSYAGAGIELSNSGVGGRTWNIISTSGGYGSGLGSLAFYGGDAGYAFTMTKEGNVSIGTAYPTSGYKLDVNGDVALSSVLSTRGASPLIFKSNGYEGIRLTTGASVSIGEYGSIIGASNVGIGYQTSINGSSCFAMGTLANAIGNSSFAFGWQASVNASHAMHFNLTGSTATHTVDGQAKFSAPKGLVLETTTGMLVPGRMTAVQAEAISPKYQGGIVFSTDGTGTFITTPGWWGWNGTTWEKLNP